MNHHISNTDLDTYLEKAVEAAQIAGALLLTKLSKTVTVEFKGTIDLVTEADKESQKCILEILTSAFPNHDFLAEESDDQPDYNKQYLWIIDPLDGTINFAHGYPCFCVSIGLMIDGTIRVGVVFDPFTGELFTAVKGKGAFRNRKRISVSKTQILDRSLLVTEFPYDIREGGINNVGLFNHLIMKVQAVRRDGSAALNLAYVAAGRFDGFWELKLHPWDVAAGILLIEEAGGTLSNFSGDSYSIDSFDLLATNGAIHQELSEAIIQIPRNSW